MDEQEKVDRVKSIGFRKLDEDEGLNFRGISELSSRKSTGFRSDTMNNIELQNGLDHLSVEKKMTSLPNFTLEYSYPAVIFEDLCFTIDKTQQKANFLKECHLNLQKLLSRDTSNQKIKILKSINLSVPCGSIFGLLGPSSCGKTTLLRCLVGLLRPTSGNIRLFCSSSNLDGDRPDSGTDGCLSCSLCSGHARNKSKVPGSNVGYMPQDLGLYEDFTIRQLLTLFGRYMKMCSSLIRERIDFMTGFLDLPDVDRDIRSLSGGQKRRVSFAIALIHMPPLIILDEPTVGVDPLLRKSIWKYLRRLASEENKTIIITTHYIEEAAQADQIALMRAGEILIQDTPSRIMDSTKCKTLEEAFLKICNNIQRKNDKESQEQDDAAPQAQQKVTRYPLSKFDWHHQLPISGPGLTGQVESSARKISKNPDNSTTQVQIVHQHNKLSLERRIDRPSLEPNLSKYPIDGPIGRKIWTVHDELTVDDARMLGSTETNNRISSLMGQKLVINQKTAKQIDSSNLKKLDIHDDGYGKSKKYFLDDRGAKRDLRRSFERSLTQIWALLYKNYRRNVNATPLLAFQFMLPIVQMVSFSLCVGGKPSNIGLGLVNNDHLAARSHLLGPTDNVSLPMSHMTMVNGSNYYRPSNEDDLLSSRYITYIDRSILDVKIYPNLREALEDVRTSKLWAAMEIGNNFTNTLLLRFDPDNFSQLDSETMDQSVIKLYPDRSNKILDMICHRSLVDSYRQFLMDEFEHLRKLPIEVKEAIYAIRPNLISNSIGGYTESIAAGLLASLTYIMAAGLTTFIMVVERSGGILERTFTSGINPTVYLVVHAVFRSFVMMIQIAVVMFLTFYLLEQPLVGSIWLAYTMLMVLNLTGITYGLLVSSIVTDQNGAALTIVSSLVVKITLSGILWPFEAIPRWLRLLCYIQPLTMPIQALKAITLKGSNLQDRVVQLGFLVSLSWLLIFLVISAKRFKFYQY